MHLKGELDTLYVPEAFLVIDSALGYFHFAAKASIAIMIICFLPEGLFICKEEMHQIFIPVLGC